jgi:hypothetical protein
VTESERAALVKSLAPAVQYLMSREVSPVSERVAVLETKASLAVPPDLDLIARQAAALIPIPKDGKDADPVDLDALVTKAAALIPVPSDGAPGPAGKDAEVDLEALAKQAAALIPVPTNGTDGKDADPVDLDVLALKAAELIPVPKDGAAGKDVDPALVLELKAEIQALRANLQAALTLAADVELLRNAVASIGGAIKDAVAEAISEIPRPTNGRDGKDAEPVDLDAVAVQAAALIPVPKDGLSVTVADVAPLVASEVQKAVSALPVPRDGKDGKDGVGMAGVLISKDGGLIVTLSDGTLVDLGGVVGRDGAPGIKGLDGVGFDDLHGEYDERGHLWIVMAKGENVHRLRVPGHVDRGVYKQGESYLMGEGATWGGSYWIAQRDTTEKPGEGSKDWRLSVKRGSDGKSITGPKGDPGPKGEPGPIGPARY